MKKKTYICPKIEMSALVSDVVMHETSWVVKHPDGSDDGYFEIIEGDPEGGLSSKEINNVGWDMERGLW